MLKKSIARKTRSIVLVVIGSIVLTGCATSIEDYNAAVIQGIVDQNNNILATGYAVISAQKSDIPAQQRILSIRASKLDAYRALMEQIYGQYLDANTTIGEMVMKSDTLKARVQGMVYGARLVSINPVGDDTYETTLSLDKNIVNDLRRLFLAARANQSLASS
ncbi:LPP20 family lipoprotein [Porticoccaceae bacterium]|nr:LPP20 family lipoprotein [Porticoccaceae bacterium]